ncbi:MAG: NAD(P)H-binding protein [Crocinitomicaceae bacterium]|nr:NAD(P)H-binding protein [Crocinitomicaceae bacterium]
MNAIIIGASGLTGSLLLSLLIEDDRYDKIKVISRSPLKVKHSKIEETIVEFDALEKYTKSFVGEHLFCCIGTTKKKTPNQSEYRKIDIDIPVNAAKICKKNDIKTLVVISAIGANASSSFFYNKTKGEMEDGILIQKIQHTIIVRPSLIIGDRQEQRPAEKLGIVLFKALQFLFIGPLKKYKAIQARSIAKSMIFLANTPQNKSVFESSELERFSKK